MYICIFVCVYICIYIYTYYSLVLHQIVSLPFFFVLPILHSFVLSFFPCSFSSPPHYFPSSTFILCIFPFSFCFGYLKSENFSVVCVHVLTCHLPASVCVCVCVCSCMCVCHIVCMPACLSCVCTCVSVCA